MCPVVRNRGLKIAKIDRHGGIVAGFGITVAILKIVRKSQELARYGTEKNVSQMCGTKMNTHVWHVARMDFHRLPRRMLSAWTPHKRPIGALHG